MQNWLKADNSDKAMSNGTAGQSPVMGPKSQRGARSSQAVALWGDPQHSSVLLILSKYLYPL